jgi:hypothetical protein
VGFAAPELDVVVGVGATLKLKSLATTVLIPFNRPFSYVWILLAKVVTVELQLA